MIELDSLEMVSIILFDAIVLEQTRAWALYS